MMKIMTNKWRIVAILLKTDEAFVLKIARMAMAMRATTAIGSRWP
jgi:hypothetical protein